MWAVRPSRSRTSASQWRGVARRRHLVGAAHCHGHRLNIYAEPDAAAAHARRAPARCVRGRGRECAAMARAYHQAGPPRRLRGAHRRHRRRRRDAGVASSSTPTRSSTPARCPTPATGSSRCSAGSSTRWTTWACGPTAATSRAPASSARSWAGCTRTATARSTTPWCGWRSPGRCGCRWSTGTATSARPTTRRPRCATPSAGWRRPRWR